MATSPPTGTVTFLFTDIEGSTKLWENNAPAMQTASASTAAAQGEAKRTARLYGVVEKLNEVMGTPQGRRRRRADRALPRGRPLSTG